MTVAAAPPLVRYALGLGDDCLVLAQRLGEWSAHAPELEEDVALTNIALDLLGQARSLLTHAGQAEGAARDEDALAYMRDERDFVNCQLVEQPNRDFAHTMARQLLYSTWQHALLTRLQSSTDPVLAGVAAKGVKEVAYHLDHARLWTLRLGDGTAESHRRMQNALDALWPYAGELFEADAVPAELIASGVAAEPTSLRAGWETSVTAVIDEATLAVPQTTWHPTGGRRGIHTESFGMLLATMQHLHRSHPGATW